MAERRRVVAVEIGRSEPARMGPVTLAAGRVFALYVAVDEIPDEEDLADEPG